MRSRKPQSPGSGLLLAILVIASGASTHCTGLLPGSDYATRDAAPSSDAGRDGGASPDGAEPDAAVTDADAPDADEPWDAGTVQASLPLPSSIQAPLQPGPPVTYEIVMSQPGYIAARAFTAPARDCRGGIAVALTLTDANGRILYFTDHDPLGQMCSRIDPLRPLGSAARVLAGTYFLKVELSGPARADVTLELATSAGVCGDNITLGPPEACDDGNRRDGDGCAHDCKPETMLEREPNELPEPSSLPIPPGEWPTISGTLDPGDDVDVYRFQVGPGYRTLVTQVSVDSFDHCFIDGELEISVLGPDGSVLATDSTHGPDGRCGRIAPELTEVALTLVPGRQYYLQIRDPSGMGVPAYFLRLATFKDVWDEVEPDNDELTTPHFLVFDHFGAQEVVGRIDPASDLDMVRLDVQLGGTLILRTHETFDITFSNPCDLDTRITLLNDLGEVEVESSDPVPGFDVCDVMFLSVPSVVPLGTHYVRVASPRSELIDRYFLYMELSPN